MAFSNWFKWCSESKLDEILDEIEVGRVQGFSVIMLGATAIVNHPDLMGGHDVHLLFDETVTIVPENPKVSSGQLVMKWEERDKPHTLETDFDLITTALRQLQEVKYIPIPDEVMEPMKALHEAVYRERYLVQREDENDEGYFESFGVDW